jgi:hypothetical protein
VADLFRHGYTIAELVLSDSACDRIVSALPEVSERRGGVRNLIEHPTVVAMLRDQRFARAIEIPGLVAVKATLFDKTPESNWRVQWHQDRLIAVRERVDADGFGPWTTKNGVVHVAPPARVLEEMIAVRVHLDDCGPENGPLRAIPGSHRRGKLTAEEIAKLAATGPIAELSVPRGALLVMRPLLVHASAPAVSASHRRVLHIELAPRDLIAPLQWRI